MTWLLSKRFKSIDGLVKYFASHRVSSVELDPKSFERNKPDLSFRSHLVNGVLHRGLMFGTRVDLVIKTNFGIGAEVQLSRDFGYLDYRELNRLLRNDPKLWSPLYSAQAHLHAVSFLQTFMSQLGSTYSLTMPKIPSLYEAVPKCLEIISQYDGKYVPLNPPVDKFRARLSKKAT